MPFPVEQRFVERTEIKLGYKLPASYVARMCTSNGGEVLTPPDSWQLYPIFDDSDKKRLKRTCNDIVHETKEVKKWRGFPVIAIAIGSNGCGDQLIFLADPGADRVGNAVYWWDHETGQHHRLAGDFAELDGGG